jgi:CDP-diacylglycerol---glycerol-3-phosphate 3-phosphatidyltransferase
MANFISIFRVFLVFLAVYFLFNGFFYEYIWAFGLTAVAFLLDGVDGYVARKFHEESKLGAVIDIIGDRIVENIYWIAFAVLGWLPIVFPIIAITRSFITDGLRSVAMEQGYTAFGKDSMQDSKIGHFICASRFSRVTYAVAKMGAFIFLILGNIPMLPVEMLAPIEYLGKILAIIAIEFCVLRGLPVVFESKKFFKKEA